MPTLPRYSPGSRESKTPVEPRFTTEHLRCSTVEPRFVPVYPGVMPRSHIHGWPRWFYYGLNLTDDPGNANFRSLIRLHYIRMIKHYSVWLRMQYGKLRTNTDCHEWCRIVSVADPASSPWMCDLGITQVVYGDVPVTAGCATVTCR